MKCRCGGETQVLDSRNGPMNTVKRVRRCTICGYRVKTIEAVGDSATEFLMRHRKARREKQKRWWNSLSPEERRAWKKREYTRASARREARETGEPVEQIYIRWGCA